MNFSCVLAPASEHVRALVYACLCDLDTHYLYLISHEPQRDEVPSFPGSSSSLAAHVLITRPSTHTYVPCLSGSTRHRLDTCFTNHSNSTDSPGTQAKLHISAHTCQHNGINSFSNVILLERKTNSTVCCLPPALALEKSESTSLSHCKILFT